MIQILKITAAKKRFLPLLTLAEPQEAVLDRYLEESEMFALYDDSKIKTIAVITKEPKRVYELKAIATVPACHRQGYGKRMMEHLLAYYHGKGRVLQAGLAVDAPCGAFFEACGFTRAKAREASVYMMREL